MGRIPALKQRATVRGRMARSPLSTPRRTHRRCGVLPYWLPPLPYWSH